ncbi:MULTISPECIES: dephospho-CoA kinase [unclassified Simplicispira]|uniref:dephospho-CoA kinase n=1 Tax=unclassified Simplicispira TaxID=2630407 RepID=UPI000D5E982D|nr:MULTISPECIES: dephospho-CoA kinase [unclassified Simplicispira]PVY54840.1 dephospho-CoA kinase [Simplicispira sp. 125]REG15782.1 dephospho-CoA kinase [Simplicispira sp. 110]
MNRAPTSSVRIGLTGGIGSGKSTVARILVNRGAILLDADQIAREMTQPGGLAMPSIVQTFGSEYMDASGALDRARMRNLAFSRPESRKQLEAILHPLVAQCTESRAYAAEAAGRRLLVFDIPLLVESGHWPRQLDAVVVVDCRTETQIDRVMARNALDRKTIEGIIAAQSSRAVRRRAADAVLYNDQLSLEALQSQVDALATRFGL